jgi:hypothetical protein
MDKDKQRIAIAEACGWKWCQMVGEPGTRVWQLQNERKESGALSSGTPWQVSYRVCDKPDESGPTDLCLVPDYLNDLNAMHEAEKVLTDEQFFDWSKDKHTDMSYNGHLFRIVDRATTPARPCRYHSASASQRAEAFLRTIGTWEE